MIQLEKFKNVIELMDYFKEEETCRLYLEHQRWGGHVCCPKCGHDKVYSLRAKGSKYSRTMFKFEVLDSFGCDYIRLITCELDKEKIFVGNLMEIETEVDKTIKSKESGILLSKMVQMNDYLESKPKQQWLQ